MPREADRGAGIGKVGGDGIDDGCWWYVLLHREGGLIDGKGCADVYHVQTCRGVSREIDLETGVPVLITSFVVMEEQGPVGIHGPEFDILLPAGVGDVDCHSVSGVEGIIREEDEDIGRGQNLKAGIHRFTPEAVVVLDKESKAVFTQGEVVPAEVVRCTIVELAVKVGLPDVAGDDTVVGSVVVEADLLGQEGWGGDYLEVVRLRALGDGKGGCHFLAPEVQVVPDPERDGVGAKRQAGVADLALGAVVELPVKVRGPGVALDGTVICPVSCEGDVPVNQGRTW